MTEYLTLFLSECYRNISEDEKIEKINYANIRIKNMSDANRERKENITSKEKFCSNI